MLPADSTDVAEPRVPGEPRVLSEPEWLARRAAHHRRVDALLTGHLQRRRSGQTHPVADFLFDYYAFRPARLRRWDPGVGVCLGGPAARDLLGRSGYVEEPRGVVLDPAAAPPALCAALPGIARLLRATADRPASYTCFGLHEWAMVFNRPEQRRHAGWPLRLGAAGTDEVLRAHRLACTHIDAVRFFTPEALPRNAYRPTRATQAEHEQPGCLHATMDLYKWAFRLAPYSGSDLVTDCFELARAARELDMRASPYDLRALGYSPVPIETAQGRARYVAGQRELAAAAAPLRSRLLDVAAALSDAAGTASRSRP